MGLAASQARFLQLTARQSDLEYKGQQVNQQRTVNADNMQVLVENMQEIAAERVAQADAGLLTDPYDPLTDDPEYAALQLELDQAHLRDRTFELDLKDIDTQHTEVQTEIDAVNKVIDKNIEQTFKTFA